MPRGKADHLGAKICVMHQQAWCVAALAQIGRGQRLDAAKGHVGGRRVIGDRPRGAYRGAGPAARADHRVDRHMIAIGEDRARGADVEAFAAPGLPGPRMRTKMRLQRHVKRFLEGADQLRGFEHRVRDCRQAARIGAQIALAFLRRGKHRRAARQIQYDIACGLPAIAGRGPAQRAPPGGIDLLQGIDAQLEPAKRAAGLHDPPPDRIKSAALGWLGPVRQQHRDAQGSARVSRPRAARPRTRR